MIKKEFLRKEEYLIKKNNIHVVTYLDKEYSERLKTIYDKPIVLYCIGDVGLLKTKSIGIVGARQASLYGYKTAQKIAYDLVQYGYTIISGMALGIDASSHQGVLNAKGKTIAVLGSGVLIIYPERNKSLYHRIIKQGGLVISEYPITMRPTRYTFPQRNRNN